MQNDALQNEIACCDGGALNVSRKKKILIVFGTRPEAIKMCPVVKAFKQADTFETIVCVTAQHREMLDQVLTVFDVVPDYDLNIMKHQQSLYDITISVLNEFKVVLQKEKPDVVLVHGDTTTGFISAMAAFYEEIPVGHVEAGLRTWNLQAPYPEEFNRQGIDIICEYLFAPTQQSRLNLLAENKPDSKIYVTGNTGIDALRTTVTDTYTHEQLDWVKGSRMILITAHRRENLGAPMHAMFRAIRRVVDQYPDVKAIYPVHLNPQVREAAREELGGDDRIRLIEPLDVLDFHNFIDASYLVITDSGGIQEEAPHLGKPVLVMRDTTERPEGIEAGTLKLVGTDEDVIYESLVELLENDEVYQAMSLASNPYGDGYASERIVKALEDSLYG